MGDSRRAVGTEGAGVLEALGESDPERIGPYELVGVLGAGGMGRVYLGRTADGGEAAVKVIHADLARDPDFRKRFGREAASTRDLSAPGVARVVASDPAAERPWLATEYVNGPSLHHVVAERGALPAAEVRALGAGLAGALAAVHAAGLVHRDVKPPNVLLAPAGPKLIDFGIARDVAASTITRTGIAIGTPQFMAPEQLEAKRSVGAPADVFALAGVLVFAATGRSPFGEGTPVQLLYAVMHTEPELDEVPTSLRPLLLRCLAKDPERRPTAAEVAAELAGEPSTHQGPGAGGLADPQGNADTGSAADAADAADTTVAGRQRRRRRLLALTAGVAAALAVAAVLVDGHAAGSDGDRTASHGGALPTVGIGAVAATTGADPATASGASAGVPSASGSRPGGLTAGSSTTPTGTGPSTSASGSKPTTTSAGGVTHATSSSGAGNPPPTSSAASGPSTSKTTPCATTTPCYAAQQDASPRIVHLIGSTPPLCLDDRPDNVAGKPAGIADTVCSGAEAQWRVWRGTTPGTVQLETFLTPGQCLTSTGPLGSPELAACAPTAADQWFVADVSGATAQLKSDADRSRCLTVTSPLAGTYVTRMAACDGSTTWRVGS